ncbi:MAG TPA: hypothetical protein VHF65_06820 [Nitrososphaera sp.]|nr:hypothetical protein [Nitrososphaera sp.]
MYNLNNAKNKSKVTTAMTSFILLTTILVVAGVGTPLAIQTQFQSADASRVESTQSAAGDLLGDESRKAPSVVSGDNIYIAWWTKNTENGNEEVMFRASTDSGATFSNSTNLSNTTNADSVDAEIAAEGETIIVTWWERNQTSNVPVARVSNDVGETFGPLLMLGMNGTLGSGEAEAVGGAEEDEGGEEAGATTGLEELLPNEEVVSTEEEA